MFGSCPLSNTEKIRTDEDFQFIMAGSLQRMTICNHWSTSLCAQCVCMWMRSNNMESLVLFAQVVWNSFKKSSISKGLLVIHILLSLNTLIADIGPVTFHVLCSRSRLTTIKPVPNAANITIKRVQTTYLYRKLPIFFFQTEVHRLYVITIDAYRSTKIICLYKPTAENSYQEQKNLICMRFIV